MFKKLVAPTLKELFVEEIEAMILSGELAIGQKLPPERELAQTMQISRSVVNDGILEMARKGFIEIIPRQGTYVADFHRNGTVEILISIMTYNGGRLPKDEIRSILELRGVLMKFSLECSIPRITEEQLTQLNEQCRLFFQKEKPEEAAQVIYGFDHMLSGFSGNTLLPLFFCSFKVPITVLWERYFLLHGMEGMHRRNMELLKHIENHDIEAAKQVIDDSIRSTISGSTEIYTK